MITNYSLVARTEDKSFKVNTTDREDFINLYKLLNCDLIEKVNIKVVSYNKDLEFNGKWPLDRLIKLGL